MLTRSAILMISVFFALSGAVAHAKVAPGLDAQGQYRDQLLQLINQPQGSGSCELGQLRGLESIGTVALGATLHSKIDEACPIPEPFPDPFENVAYL